MQELTKHHDWVSWDGRSDVSILLGKTLAAVQPFDDEQIVFLTTEGEKFLMYHSQDCCESVGIESIVGDLQDLVGSPLTLAEEVSSDGVAPKDPDDAKWGSFTWTFYKFATVKGYVDVRWYGTSNGYYSESVDFARIQATPA